MHAKQSRNAVLKLRNYCETKYLHQSEKRATFAAEFKKKSVQTRRTASLIIKKEML